MKNYELERVKILHLEDDPMDCTLVRNILDENDLLCDIVQVDCSEGYSRAFADHHFDIILSDYTLPSFDGFSALKIAIEKSPRTPFVFLSGTLDDKLAIEALQRGASDYVRKTDINRLIPSLEKAVLESKKTEELKQAIKEKQILENKLLHAQKFESVGRLAAGIAHEINTPTQFVCYNLDFMEDASLAIIEFVKRIQQIAESSTPETAEAIKKALVDADWDYLAEELPKAICQSLEGTSRVASIVRSMKEFSHPGGKEKQLRNINQIVESTVSVARNEWKYVAEIELDLNPDLPQIQVLADEMGQVVLNLLVNAAQAISEKLGDNPEGNKGIINITTRKTGEFVELLVGDTGTGIPESSRAFIFHSYYTTKDIGKGTGQGLAISHNVITEKHGGSIDFTTEVGKGTQFLISLPI